VRLTRGLLLGAAVVSVALSGGSGVPSAPPAADQVVPRAAHVTVPEQVSFDDLPPTLSRAELATSTPTPVVPRKRPPDQAGGRPGSWPAAGTAQAVLASAYRDAAADAPRSCRLDVSHLAAIGQVESGSVGGRSVGRDHRVSPEIYGPLLDGGPFAVIRDTDDGRYDGDAVWDRAMGPLQFLPGTWTWAGRDGDGDGRRDPQNVFDAALATAGYLCEGGRDLSLEGHLRSAVLSYNQSDDYLASVLEWVAYFERHGLGALDDVAFRVGSGGRASDLETPEEEVKPPGERSGGGTAAAAKPTSRPAPTPSASARPTTTAGPAAPTPATTPTGTPTSSETVTSVPTVPVPSPTTTTAPPTTEPPPGEAGPG